MRLQHEEHTGKRVAHVRVLRDEGPVVEVRGPTSLANQHCVQREPKKLLVNTSGETLLEPNFHRRRISVKIQEDKSQFQQLEATAAVTLFLVLTDLYQIRATVAITRA